MWPCEIVAVQNGTGSSSTEINTLSTLPWNVPHWLNLVRVPGVNFDPRGAKRIIIFNRLNLILYSLSNPHQQGGLLKRCFTLVQLMVSKHLQGSEMTREPVLVSKLTQEPLYVIIFRNP